MRDLGLGWITPPAIVSLSTAVCVCVCVDVGSTHHRPLQAHWERTCQVWVPAFHRLTCRTWCQWWVEGVVPGAETRLHPQASAQPPGHRQSPEGALGQAGPPSWWAQCPPGFRRWKTAAAYVRPRSRALTKCFLSRPAESMQGHRGFALPRVPGPRISLG